jgi:hypothetical protein
MKNHKVNRALARTRSVVGSLGRKIGAMGGATLALALTLQSCGDIPISTPFYSTVDDERALEHKELDAKLVHGALFNEEQFPSARTCQSCHPDHYEEWSVSPHAYAQLSPVFNTMQAAVIDLNNGSFGDFCIRCHNPVGMNLNEPVFESNLYRHPASREGVTCITCHRPKSEFGKLSGRFDVERGTLNGPVLGPTGNKELKRFITHMDEEKGISLATSPEQTGTQIHGEAKEFFYLTQPGFCGACHDVNLGNGFRLEEAFSEYKQSPAAAEGTSCQDCHMGLIHGVNSGYAVGPAAVVAGESSAPRKRTNHMFAGPDYSIVHPGIFPHAHGDALALATLGQWLNFDVEGAWGSDEFEDEIKAKKKIIRARKKAEEDYSDIEIPDFKEPWDNAKKRKRGWAMIKGQKALLARYSQAQMQVLRAGYKIGDMIVDKTGEGGIEFRVEVQNGTDGHNVPTGFIAERTVILQVTVTDSEGTVVMRSGDMDPNGDVRDSHSIYVHNGELHMDEQLFSLQSKFLTRNVRGSERDQVLPINHSVDPLPFLRPATFSVIATGEPRGARIHRQGIEPNGHRWAKYKVKADELTGKGPYSASIKVISGMVPPNLIDAIKHVGFDYGMTAREVADKVVAGRSTLHNHTLDLSSKGTQDKSFDCCAEPTPLPATGAKAEGE